MFDSLRLHGLYPIRFLCSWNSPGKNTGVGHWGEKRPGAAGRRALSGGAYVFGELLCLRRPLLLRFTSFATTMAEYSYVKSTKLVLKGTKAKSKKKKSKEKKRKREEDEETQLDIVGELIFYYFILRKVSTGRDPLKNIFLVGISSKKKVEGIYGQLTFVLKVLKYWSYRSLLSSSTVAV